jgi:hypothetical protein
MGSVLSPAEQAAHMAALWPALRPTRRGPGHYTWKGWFQPRIFSDNYLAEIDFGHGQRPDVRVLEPCLVRRTPDEEIPHMYEQKMLCLYLPYGHEFDPGRSLATQIAPWISLWLFHYEAWHATGIWGGGGVHPERTPPRTTR